MLAEMICGRTVQLDVDVPFFFYLRRTIKTSVEAKPELCFSNAGVAEVTLAPHPSWLE